MDVCTERLKYSAITSLAMALVALWLTSFPQYVNPAVAWLSFFIFLFDAYAKWTNSSSRRVSTILFSLANALLILAGFYYAGYPASYVIAFLWLIDTVLKIPGINTPWEGAFRHAFSAFMTVVTGLSLMFSIRIFGSAILSFLLGWFVLFDAWYKIRYVRERCFVYS